MTKKSKKPEKIAVGSGATTAYLTNAGKVEISVSSQWDHLSRADALALGKRMIEMAEYEPQPWIPKPGELFRVHCGGIIFMRLLEDLDSCPSGAFSDVAITGPDRGYVGYTCHGVPLIPATFDDLKGK